MSPRPAARWPVGLIVTLVLFTLLGGALDLVFSFGMLFAGDSCGTGARGSAAVCSAGVWLLVLALPWAGLVGALLVGLIGGELSRRRDRSPWLAMPVAVALYAIACAVTWLVLFGVS
jgi:hypothetical protein